MNVYDTSPPTGKTVDFDVPLLDESTRHRRDEEQNPCKQAYFTCFTS